MLKVEDHFLAVYILNKDNVMNDLSLCEAIVASVGDYANFRVGQTVYFRRSDIYGSLTIHLNNCNDSIRDELADCSINCMVKLDLISKTAVLATNNRG